jgi:uncharacterized protein
MTRKNSVKESNAVRPSESLAKHRDEVLEIIAKYPVSNPRVFGSVARGEDVEGSDIDIVIDPDADCSYFHLFRIEDAISAVLKVNADVHTLKEFGPRMLSRVEIDLKPL